MIDPAQIGPIPRFAGLSPDAKSWLCERASLLVLSNGEQIFMEGDDCRFLHIVLRGEVKVFKCLENGREIILNFFHAGEAFGEVAAIDGGDYPANATAQGETTVIRLEREHYLELLQRFPEAGLAIIRDLSLRMRSLRERVELMGESGVQARIAHLLLAFGQRIGREEGNGFFIPVSLTRGEIAAMVCARNETVIRIMSRWNKLGLVQREGEGFRISDQSTLSSLMQEGT